MWSDDSESDTDDRSSAFSDEDPDDGEWAETRPHDGTVRPRADDERLADVASALEHVEPPGEFFAGHEWTRYPLPGIVVDGIGTVPIPLIQATADVLVAACLASGSQRPEGAWEIPATRFHLTSARWDQFVGDALSSSLPTLGLKVDRPLAPSLRRLVVYEAGGRRDKSVASVAPSAMGTMLFVLPSVFDGGIMATYEPTCSGDRRKTHVWNQGGASPYTVRGGVFYRDCEFEVRTITRGFLLCLEYDLLVVEDSGSHKFPRHGDNHESYHRLEDALREFFVGYPVETDLQFGRKLVYVLQNETRKQAVSFDTLDEEGTRVARSLEAFCRASDGAFRLFMCQASTSTSRFRETIGDMSGTPSRLELHAPWTASASSLDVLRGNGACATDVLETEASHWRMAANVASEVVIATPGLNVDSCEEQWVVLVVLSAKLFYQIRYAGDPSATLAWWATLADSQKEDAREAAAAFAQVAPAWPFQGSLTSDVLIALDRLGELQPIQDLLVCCSEMAFEPVLRELVVVFEWDAVVTSMAKVCDTWQHMSVAWAADPDQLARRCVNLAASILHGETNGDRITVLLDSIDVNPFSRRPSRRDLLYDINTLQISDSVTTSEEYSRILMLAWTVSPRTMRSYLASPDHHKVVLVIAPALMRLAETTYKASQKLTTDLRDILVDFRSSLCSRLDSIRHISYLAKVRCDVIGTRQSHVLCSQCSKLKWFMRSEDLHELTFKMAKFEPHLRKMIQESLLGKLFEKNVSTREDGLEIMTLKKSFQNKLYNETLDVIKRLDAWINLKRASHNEADGGSGRTDVDMGPQKLRTTHMMTPLSEPLLVSASSTASNSSAKAQTNSNANGEPGTPHAKRSRDLQRHADEATEDEDDDVEVIGVTPATQPPVPLSHWTELLQRIVIPIAADGYCLYRAFLAALLAESEGDVTNSDVLKLKNKVMDVVIASLKAEIDARVLDPLEAAKELELEVGATTRPDHLFGAIRRHYRAIRRRPFVAPAPRSHWGRPPHLRALAKIARQPIFVIDDLGDKTHVQRYSFQEGDEVGRVDALSTAEAEWILRHTDHPIVLVLQHNDANGHFDALAICPAKSPRRTGQSGRAPKKRRNG